jgi:hypothetical protein
MSFQEILERAVTKAIDGGWSPLISEEGYVPVKAWRIKDAFTIMWYADDNHNGTELNFWQAIYLNHDFAKALWGETKDFVELSKTFERGVVAVAIDGWQYHLQQMVIADDPIKYLVEHL